MDKTKHTIVLNGHHYDARTGTRLSHAGTVAHTHKTEASHHAPVHKTVSHQPAPRKAVHRTARQAAGHIKAHTPKATRTLMRQSVKKPGSSFKRNIRVAGRLDSQLKHPDITPPQTRLQKTKQRNVRTARVHLIRHFSPDLFTVTSATVIATKPAPKRLISDKPIANNDVTPRKGGSDKKPQTTADLLEYVVRYANDPYGHEEPAHRKHARKHRRTHAAAH